MRIRDENEVDYAKIGLRVGLEIHQRLGTSEKLFCSCKPQDDSQVETGLIRRRLRPVAGEIGGVDPAALYEYLKGKKFVYKIYKDTTCLVEADCEPPHRLNREALEISLQMSKLLGCTVPDEIHVMRKTVIDGSNTGGFQRTAVVGLDGYIEMPWGTVKIEQVALEEESARIEHRAEGEVIYRLSGLGIPLVEITTGIVDDPKKAKQLAQHIGLLLRSTKVQRGIGTIRQDVNVSIIGGARIEIKGFQELAEIDKLVMNEAKRQLDLLAIKDELTRRGSKNSTEEKDLADVTSTFAHTQNHILQKILSSGARVFALRLDKFQSLLLHSCGDRTLGKELASYAQSYGLGGIIHTDEDLSKYQLASEFEQMKKHFESVSRAPLAKQRLVQKEAEQDLYIIFAGPAQQARAAALSVMSRANELKVGVPEETRVADGTGSKFARPLPGKARMYPETDVPPMRISQKYLESIIIPKTLEEKAKELEKILPQEIVEQLITSRVLSLYENLSKDFEPLMVAITLTNTTKDLHRQGLPTEKLAEEGYREIFRLVKNKKIPREAISDALSMKVRGEDLDKIEAAFGLMSDDELRSIIREIARFNKGKKESVLMGLVMQKVRGRASGEKVIKILREEMK